MAECEKVYGRLLIDEKLRQNGASIADLANKCGTNKTVFYGKMRYPDRLTLKEVRAISAALGFTAEEIYNSFILYYGWRRDCVKGYEKLDGEPGKDAGSELPPDTKSSKRGKKQK